MPGGGPPPLPTIGDVANDAGAADQPEPVSGTRTERAESGSRWPASRIRRVAARAVLVLAGLLTVLCLSLIGACAISDRTISESRGSGVAEVLDTSMTRTVVRFSTPDGGVYIPPNGALYPMGLQKGQHVAIEYDTRNPDLVRVAGRGMVLSLLPVLTVLAVVWLVLGPAWWLLRRSARR